MYYKFWKRPTIFPHQFSNHFPHTIKIIFLFFIKKNYDVYNTAVNLFLKFFDFSCFEHKNKVKNRYKHVMRFVFF